jgi:tRNA modification GTPase
MYLGFVFDPDGGVDVDEVLAVSMEAPRTYTREKMAEIYSHGGMAAQQQILAIVMKNGARVAEPGEFTKRAFLSGRIDLAQAESVLDIIQSESASELQSAVIHVKGGLSEKIDFVKSEIQGLLAEVEAGIDFPDEGLEIREHAWPYRLEGVRHQLSDLISSYHEGRAIKHGLDVLIVGKANVGKSSLLNALVLSDRAIVTPIPGTTRDLLEDTIHIKGLKARITDTAGLRTPVDAIEEEGINRVKKRIPEADMILWVLDASKAYTSDDEAVYDAFRDKKAIAVLNKADLPRKIGDGMVSSKGLDLVDVSALTGSGLERLKERLYETLVGSGQKGSVLLVTNARHKDALTKTNQALGRAEACCIAAEPPEFIAFELRDALSCLGEITGETCPEELLGQIFSRFCVGK